MKIFKNLLFVALLFVTATIFGQGVTTSAVSGKITDGTGLSLPGASVLLVHTPSGTKYGSSTDFDGFYRVSNMRTGGPYTITISYIGYKNFVENGIYLTLGETKRINKKLSEDENVLQEVIITSTNGVKNGAETKISRKQLDALPTLSRSIADFARLTPQAQVGSDGSISISGQNNRFNAIYLDGAVNNDVFGLTDTGTNGGDTGVSPISLDAIESFQINVSPFDVKQSGFAGGSINAITRSGTNQLKASVYSFLRNEQLAGKTPVDLVTPGDERERLAKFNILTYGARVGGAIKKDKLFYFVNYEREDSETPNTFNFDRYNGEASATDLENLRQFVDNNFNYNPGQYTTANGTLKSDKLIAKIDWNINENHKLSVKHSYVKAVSDAPNGSNSRTINFQNGARIFNSTTNTSSLELNSTFGNKYSNNLIIGYTDLVDDRTFAGEPFPNVEIRDGSGRIFFGSSPFDTANLLETRVVTITDNFEIYSGKHKVTLGTHNEFSSVNNVFFGRNFGYYRYSNLNDFLTGNNANRYRIGYSLIGGNGDESLGAATFDAFQFGLYVQDEIDVSSKLRFTAGIRLDVPFYNNGRTNDFFTNNTVPLLEAAGKDLQGAEIGQGISSKLHISPRVGFSYDVNEDKSTVIRGGAGIFVSRLPLVWPGGVYNNNGITAGRLDVRDGSVPFEPNVNNQFKDPLPGATNIAAGVIDLFAKDFKLPQVLKTNIAIDQKLPNNFYISADLLLNETITGIQYENLNLVGPQFQTAGPGSRPNFGNQLIDDSYPGIYLASNTNQGNSWNISTTLGKNYYSDLIDFRGQATYSYGDANVINDATSSQNSSQWARVENVNGANNLSLSRSDFSQGHRFLAQGSFDFKWNKYNKTTIGIFYNGNEGNVISYTYNDDGDIPNDSGEANSLIFVPATQADINLVDSSSLTAAEQWDLLDDFISSNDYLSTRRGQFAERNADRASWTHIVDLKFAHEFKVNKNRLELTADIFNFTNLLNKDWGVRNISGSFNTVQLIDFEGFAADNRTPEFTYNPSVLNRFDRPAFIDSRWRMQVGIRYSFN